MLSRMDLVEFAKEKKLKQDLIKLLEKKKKYLEDSLSKSHSRSYQNFLSLGVKDEQKRCYKLLRQSRSFSLLCHSETEEALNFLNSCSAEPTTSHHLLSLCDVEALQHNEEVFCSTVSRYSELLFYTESESAQELGRAELEREASALREAFALAWYGKIRESLRFAKLHAQADYLKSHFGVPNVILSKFFEPMFFRIP